MKLKDVQEGGFYSTRISGIGTVVKIVRQTVNVNHRGPYREPTRRTGFTGVNLRTGRDVAFRSAARLKAPVSVERIWQLVERGFLDRDVVRRNCVQNGGGA